MESASLLRAYAAESSPNNDGQRPSDQGLVGGGGGTARLPTQRAAKFHPPAKFHSNSVTWPGGATRPGAAPPASSSQPRIYGQRQRSRQAQYEGGACVQCRGPAYVRSLSTDSTKGTSILRMRSVTFESVLV